MSKIKKVLILAHPESDHLAYMMYNGLYKILGKENIDIYPYIRHYQGGTDDWYILDDGKKGYTVPMAYTCKHETPEKSFDELSNNINSYDIIYLSSGRTYVRKALDQFIDKCDRKNLPPLVLSEGEDYSSLDTIKNIKYKYKPIVCFKRELIKKDLEKNKDLYPLYPLPFSAISDSFLPDNPNKDNPNKDIDVFVLFGNTHPIRENIIKIINSNSISKKYKICANILNHSDIPEMTTPWGDKRKISTYHLMRYQKYLDYMSRAKINIVARGWGYDSVRRFEAPYFSGLVLSDDIPIITPNPFIDKQHVVYYNNDLSNLIELIEYYLNHPEEREKIGKAGREHCINYHTTEARVRYFLDKVEQHL